MSTLNSDFVVNATPLEKETILKLIKSLLLPEQSYGEDRPSEDADFSTFRTEVVFGLKTMDSLLQNYHSKPENRGDTSDILVWSLLLLGEHSSPSPWTTNESLEISASCLQALCSLHGCSTISQLVLKCSPNSNASYFKKALLLLRPKLMQDSWRKSPGAVLTYQWLLSQVRSPHLSEYVDLVSPTALIIIDDHDVDRRLTGIHCLSHIIDNVARSEMCGRGLHLVFYKTLEPLIWQRSAKLVEPGIHCLIKLLNVTERGYTRSTEPGMWDLFDNTMSNLLHKMITEDQVPLRKAYIKSLCPLLSAMGPSVIRWCKPLAEIFDEYLHRESFDTRDNALEAVEVYIRLSSPRLTTNGDFILYLLLRTLQDVTSDPNDQHNSIKSIEACIVAIREAAPVEFSSLKNDLEGLKCNSTMESIIQRCWCDVPL